MLILMLKVFLIYLLARRRRAYVRGQLSYAVVVLLSYIVVAAALERKGVLFSAIATNLLIFKLLKLSL